MFIGSLLAVLPILGLASATAVPRASAPFGRLHPIRDINTCIAASELTVGAEVSLVECHESTDPASTLELWNIPTAGPLTKILISPQADTTLCLDGGLARAGDKITLQECGINDRGQLLSRSDAGLISFQDAFCFHKKSATELDIQTCYTMDDPLKFYPS